MRQKKAKKGSGSATRASVKSEMAKPRITKSARKMERILDATRIPEYPSTSMPGTVDKLIPSRRTRRPERAQIAVDRTDQRYRKLRIENSLTDEHGDEVKLKKGAHVEVTVTSDPKR
ncbi:MAG TPA: hypothetical protein VIH88_01680 [Candidatus Acidoferrales bacterium]